MYRWTPKGSIDRSILLEVVKNIDVISVYNEEREEGLKYMLLIDAHDNRFNVYFLEYINNPVAEWAVYIGVTYGTSLW